MPLTDSSVRFGEYEVDLNTAELRKNGTKVKLQDQPFQILVALLEQPGKVVSREALRRKLWPTDVYVDYERGLNTAMKKLREALEDEADKPRYIETLPRHGYRFIGHLEARPNTEQPKHWYQQRVWLGCSIAVAALLALGIVYYVRHGRVQALSERDTVVVADFVNKTNEPVFTDTLRQGLLVQLSQSPFLNIVPDNQVRATLRRMGLKPDQALVGQVASEVCQRNRSKVYIEGSIANLGSVYVLSLRAVTCLTGELVAQEQEMVERKEDLLKVLGKEGSGLRRRLGETLASVKSDVPLSQATTSSLEALQAYTIGMKQRGLNGDRAAIPYFRRAVELDPEFALAWSALGHSTRNQGNTTQGEEYIRKAYLLREKLTEPERLIEEANYYVVVTGEIDKAIQAWATIKSSYPRNGSAYTNLASSYEKLGKYEKALAEAQQAVKLSPNNGFAYGWLADCYMDLNRLDEAKRVLGEAQARGVKGDAFLVKAYVIAFLEKNPDEMERILRSATAEAGGVRVLGAKASTEAFSGLLTKARRSSQFAIEAAKRSDLAGYADLLLARAALREAFLGNPSEASRNAAESLKADHSRTLLSAAALAFARIGNLAQANALVEEMRKYSADTEISLHSIPTIEAVIEIRRGNPARAVEILETTSSVELGDLDLVLQAVYTRGEAYLALGKGSEAAAEFQKILDRPGIVVYSPIAPLAHLGMARAQVLQGNTDKARAEYEYFLHLWKDADPDLPVYRQAKAEYAKLNP
jgi:eukaryotic-like serine/threonine-protein kinase